MAITGKEIINISSQNQQVGSDSLFIAFNKINNNFTSLFNSASPYVTFVGKNGISTSTDQSTVTIKNTGVTKLTPGTGISLSGSNGNITVSVSGDITGNLVAGVTSVGLKSNTLSVVDGPVVGSGNIQLELSVQPNIFPSSYVNPVVTVDQYGRITDIVGSTSSGTVTSVGLIPGDGVAVTGGPITSSGAIRVTNTGVTKLTAGPGINLSGSNGAVTISASIDRDTGTVTKIGIVSNTLTVSTNYITTMGNLSVDLPNSITINDTITSNNIVTGNLTTGNLTVAHASLTGPSNIKIGGGTSGYVLQTDGTGNLTWTQQTGSSGSLVAAAGANTQVQFNDTGVIGASSNLTFNKTTGILTATKFSGNAALLSNIPAANITGILNQVTVTNGIRITTGDLTVAGNVSVDSGKITSVTAIQGTRNTQLATTAFVKNEIDAVFTSFGLNTVSPANIAAKANINSPTFTGTPTSPTISQSAPGTNAIATTQYVKAAITAAVNSISTNLPSGVPTGGIIMWSGSVATIPTGWQLCNGANGSPDLRNRFVVGAGSTYNPNVIGGSANAVLPIHSHSVSSTFYGDAMRNHNHTVVDNGHSHTVNDPGHFHGLWGTTSAHDFVGMQESGRGHGIALVVDNSNPKFYATNWNKQQMVETKTTGISINSTSSGVFISPVTAGTPTGTVTTVMQNAGVDPTNANLPPYYALCYIMKL